MIKKLSLTLIVITSIFITLITVKAYDTEEELAKQSFVNFIYLLNQGDEEVFTYVDSKNKTLIEEINEYLNNINVTYNNPQITKQKDNSYFIKTKIDASGENWNVSGFNVEFNLIKANDKYVISNTTLFDVTGTKNVMKFVGKIFLLVIAIFIIVGSFILGAYIIIKRKHKEEYNGNI